MAHRPIRVGVIRCDLHALYYACLMDDHDPLLLRGPNLIRREKMRDSWLNGGAHFYFYTHYADPCRMTAPRVSGFRIARLWDRDPEIAEVASRIFHGRPRVCRAVEEASDDVDMVFIADCNGDGSDHLRLATPGLRKGVPTFVDKPVASTRADARAMVRLAARHDAPLLSLSILRTVPQFTLFRRRFAEVGGARFGVIKGGGRALAGQIHAISLAQHLFGDGVQSVACMGDAPLDYIHLGYGDRKDRPSAGVVLNCASGPTPHCAFFASAFGPLGAVHSPPIGDFEFPRGAARNLELARRMVRQRRSPVPSDEMLENIAVVEAARLAHRLGRPALISEVWRR
jgi:hypothetical protein